MAHLNNGKKTQKGGVGHRPRAHPNPTKFAIFKVISPPLATSHGGGALVDVVVRGAEVPGSNPWASPPTAYVIWYLILALDLV
jgi:hypothetical protein